MLVLGNMVSASSTKKLAANTAATASNKAAQSGNSAMMTADTSCHKLSKRDLQYFSSEKFTQVLKSLEDRELAKSYGKLIASRKKVTNLLRAYEVVDAIIYVDIFDAHYDGFRFTYEEVKDLFRGYRSQALREIKLAKGFNQVVYRELAKALERPTEIRSFLKAVNAPIIRSKVSF